MTHREATTLLDNPALHNLTNGASPATPQRWADLGCGSGTFTLALAEYLAPGSTIAAIDLQPSIRAQTTAGGVDILPQSADFVTTDFVTTGLVPTGPPPSIFDGILMANSLHYVADQPRFIQKLHAAIKPGGLFVLVEYDTDIAVSRWVPYPLSFEKGQPALKRNPLDALTKDQSKRSAFGRSNLYSGYTVRLGA